MTFEKDSSDTKGITFCLILRGRKEPLALAFLHQHLKHARWELLYQIPLGVGRKQKVKKNFNLNKVTVHGLINTCIFSYENNNTLHFLFTNNVIFNLKCQYSQHENNDINPLNFSIRTNDQTFSKNKFKIISSTYPSTTQY